MERDGNNIDAGTWLIMNKNNDQTERRRKKKHKIHHRLESMRACKCVLWWPNIHMDLRKNDLYCESKSERDRNGMRGKSHEEKKYMHIPKRERERK